MFQPESALVRPGRPVWLTAPLRGLRAMLRQLACLKLRRVKQAPLVPQETSPAQHLVARAADAAAATASLVLLPLDEAERLRMHEELGRLLDQHPAARSLFPSLSLVERALRSDGAIDLLPTDVVRDASTLLVQLASDHSADGLAVLRGRLRRLRAARCQVPV